MESLKSKINLITRPACVSATTLVVALVLAVPGFAQQHSDRPNVILIMADDLGWADLKFNNPKSKILTPHLDQMASNSLRLNRFYAAAPVCSPTRGSCLTGRHPYRYGVYGANRGHLKPEEKNLAEWVKTKGYRTGHFGKWHLGTLTKTIKDSNRGGPKGVAHFSPPQLHGFDVCFSTEAKVPTHDPMLKPKNAGKTAWDAIKDSDQTVAYGTRFWNEKGEVVQDNLKGDDSKLIMDRATHFVKESVDDRKPFFAVIWFHAPHLPVVAAEKDIQSYRNLGVHQRNYFGCVSALDRQVGRLRKQLRDLKVADNTLIFFCSDNGPEGNVKSPGRAEPFRGRKRSLYEGGVRVPALIEWPAKIKKPIQADMPAVTSDYLPTVLQILGIKNDSNRPLDGVSLLPLINGNSMKREKPIGFQAGNQQAWSSDRYKIYRSKNQAWELYDLIDDPSESTNLADVKKDLVKQMEAQFQAWQESCRRSDRGEDYRERSVRDGE